MSYDPATYWTERHARQGPTYVARGGRQAEYEREYNAVAPFLGAHASGKVLDFGCGSGRFRKLLESVCTEYIGFDLVPGLGTGEPEQGTCDTVVATFVLQHIVDEGDYTFWTDAIYRALKPGGLFVVVDHVPMEGMDAHMKPRGIEGLLRLPWAGTCVEKVEDGHWYGWLVK